MRFLTTDFHITSAVQVFLCLLLQSIDFFLFKGLVGYATFHDITCRSYPQGYEQSSSSFKPHEDEPILSVGGLPPRSMVLLPFQDLKPFAICVSTEHQCGILISLQFFSNF